MTQIAESIPADAVVETADYSDFAITPVGLYVSPSREIGQIRKKDDGTVTVELILAGGVQAMNNGGTVYAKTFPLRHWLSSRLFTKKDRPGQTSSLAEYLRACGLETSGKGTGELLKALPETLNTPVGVFVGRTDRSERQADGSWTNANLKTKDFKSGVDDAGEPVYAASVTINGKSFRGKEKVQGFQPIQ